MKVKNYVKPASLEEAYELNQKRSSRLVGGMMWMRLGRGTIQTAVDLSGLGLDTIEETEEEFRIGCMVTLRQLELQKALNDYTEGSIREAVRSIVGVQFRNLATVGGSIWGRFGFSDVLTAFLALDTRVELYKGGQMSLREFADRKKDNDILVRIIVKKRPQRTAYQSFRNTKTDFPVLNCSVGIREDGGVAVVGARPGRAKVLELPEELCRKILENGSREEEGNGSIGDSGMEKAAAELASQIPVGSNLRGSGEYRTHLAKVLLLRALRQIAAGTGEGSGKEREDEENRGGAEA